MVKGSQDAVSDNLGPVYFTIAVQFADSSYYLQVDNLLGVFHSLLLRSSALLRSAHTVMHYIQT